MHAYYFIRFTYIRDRFCSTMENCKLESVKRKSPEEIRDFGCGAEWIRTTDSRIFSPMLYQLSYSTVLKRCKTMQ